MTFSVARDFSKFPGPRFRSQGPHSGEELASILAKLLRGNPRKRIEIILDGTRGFGSSFLDQAFGGLISVHKFPREEIAKRLLFTSKRDPSYIDEVMESIDRAVPGADE